jgi:hypothetical protein
MSQFNVGGPVSGGRVVSVLSEGGEEVFCHSPRFLLPLRVSCGAW